MDEELIEELEKKAAISLQLASDEAGAVKVDAGLVTASVLTAIAMRLRISNILQEEMIVRLITIDETLNERIP